MLNKYLTDDDNDNDLETIYFSRRLSFTSDTNCLRRLLIKPDKIKLDNIFYDETQYIKLKEKNKKSYNYFCIIL
jgi:hypothetical protein